MTVQGTGDPHDYCIHRVVPYLVCPQCLEIRRQEKREEALYATLDKLADAVNALTARDAA